MEKVKITVISPGKSGTTNGKEWSKIGIKVEGNDRFGDVWINGFANKTTQGWTVGSVVNLEISEDSKWGFQFKIPTATDNLEARVACLEESVNALLRAVPSADTGQNEAQAVVNKIEEPEPVPPPEEDSPF